MMKTKKVDMPNTLYHYYKLDQFSEKIFSDFEIYFSSPLNYNDPFDCNVRPFDNQDVKSHEITTYLNKIGRSYGLKKPQIAKMAKHPQAKDVLKTIGYEFVKKIGIYCLSENKDNLLMWAHYSQNHSGFCLGFKTDCPFFGRAQQITYSLEYPQFNFFTERQDIITRAMLLTKASDWSYEKEWRLIDHNVGYGPQKYPKESLVEIILGCRIAPDDKKKIISWASKFNVGVIQLNLSKDKFALDSERLN